MKLINFLLFHSGCPQTEFPPGCIQVHVCSGWQYQLYCALFVALRRSRCSSSQQSGSDIPCYEALSHPGPWPFQNTRGGQWVNMALGVLFPFVVSGCAKLLNYAKLKFQIRGPLEFSCSFLGATWASIRWSLRQLLELWTSCWATILSGLDARLSNAICLGLSSLCRGGKTYTCWKGRKYGWTFPHCSVFRLIWASHNWPSRPQPTSFTFEIDSASCTV